MQRLLRFLWGAVLALVGMGSFAFGMGFTFGATWLWLRGVGVAMVVSSFLWYRYSFRMTQWLFERPRTAASVRGNGHQPATKR